MEKVFKAPRNRNIELYRIICMFLIVAHHFVVNSGLWEMIFENPSDVNSLYLGVFGLWGKTGINCFMMITGYYMCKSNITFQKLFKLVMWIFFYNIVVFVFMFVMGYESISPMRILRLFLPIWGLKQNFTSCFLAFYLTIPFLNILVKNMNQLQHKLLIALMIVLFTILGSVPGFEVSVNYVFWFAVIYFIASYIRFYPNQCMNNSKLWGILSCFVIILSLISLYGIPYVLSGFKSIGLFPHFHMECNRLFPVLISVCTFLWFKNISIPNNGVINTIAASCFGVLLIHTNSDAMRQWLWKDVAKCTTCINMDFTTLVVYSFAVVLAVYIVCTLVDIFRMKFIEPGYMSIVSKLTNKIRDRYGI